MTAVRPSLSEVTSEEVFDILKEAVLRTKAQALRPDQITLETPLWSEAVDGRPPLALDSIDFLEIVVHLEDAHGWTIPETALDVFELTTVGELTELVVQHLGGNDQ